MKRVCLFTLVYLTVTDSRLLPVTKSPARKAFDKKHAQILPQDFIQNGRGLFESIKIPNSEFCSEMILRPEDHYLVLPWWYHYCQDLKEKHKKGMPGNVNYGAVHKYILGELQLFKKRVNQKNFKMSDLEHELVAANRVNQKKFKMSDLDHQLLAANRVNQKKHKMSDSEHELFAANNAM